MGHHKEMRPRSTGFSLVELMVGMVIGLLGVLVIMQVFTASESQKRTTSGGANAQMNGAIALYTVTRDISMAGYGLTSAQSGFDYFGCTVRAYNALAPSPGTFTFNLVPLQINQGANGAPDEIEVTYGNSDGLAVGVPFDQQSGSAANYKIQNGSLRNSFQVGDLVIAVEQGKDCSLAQVTQLPGSTVCSGSGGAGQSDVVVHNAGNFKNPYKNCSMVSSSYNKPGGLGVTYTSGLLFNVGSAPVVNKYEIDDNHLELKARFPYVAAEDNDNDGYSDYQLVNGVVDLQAEYGMDNGINNGTVSNASYVANDGVVDEFTTTTPANAAQWGQLLAVRIGLVARSGTREVGTVTTSAPTWTGGAFTHVTTLADWQHYRYKVFETVAPLRNMIWRQ